MSAAHPPAEACIFDMDGLLVDSEPFWRRVETAVFADIGVDISPLIARRLTMGMRVDEVVAFFRAQFGFIDPSGEVLISRIVDGVVDAIRREGTALPGSYAALELCERAGVRLALASGSTWPVIDAVLERLDLGDRFEVVCSAEDDLLGKPHPAILLRAAAALGLGPEVCVVVEDSLNGCIAARAARMRIIAVPEAAFTSDVRFSIADLVLGSLTEFSSAPVGALFGFSPATVDELGA